MQRLRHRPASLYSSRAMILPRNLIIYASSLIAPFIMVVLSLLYPKDPASRNVIWIFVVYYGTVFFIANGSGADSVRHAAWLEYMHQGDMSLGELTSLLFAEGSQYQDIYQPLVTFFVSLFTGSHAVLFATFGVLFGYVYSRNVWFLIDRVPGSGNLLLLFLLVAFAFQVNIGSSLNGVRMGTALHVFAYGVMHYLSTGNRKFIIVMFLSTLVHFSLWLPCVVLVLYFFIRHLGMGIYCFFLVSLVMTNLDISIVKTLISYFPIPIDERASSYINAAAVNPDIMALRGESLAWFLKINQTLTSIFFVTSASWMIWRGVLNDKGLIRSLLLLGMLLYGVINLLNYIPSLGRFYNLAGMLLLASVILYLATSNRQKMFDNAFFSMLALLLIIDLALAVRLMLGFTSIWLITGNFITAPFVEADQSLYQSLMWVLSSFL
ncbi:EpsG family protein [Halomonas maura]|uniref:EpsG family protein n=1 Tax=Halomonas maura TaxID=117606 RepID=UPI0025B35525|nr:EpsG family protein [Halomonas maura]MDN3555230.1 EpsG family protein [Halomonas maura]